MEHLDVGRLLQGLRRGLVPGADGSVEFLCNKFSALIDRLKEAEAKEARERENYKVLEATAQAEEQQSDAERRRLEVATITAREETRKVESLLTETLQEEMKAKEGLAALRVEAEALAQRKRVLEETCRTEHAKHGEAHGRLRRRQMSKPPMLEELRRLQTQMHTLGTRSTAIAAEMEVLQARAVKDEESFTKLKAELSTEDEVREQSLASATVCREDLDQALSDLASLQEQLAERQVAIQRLGGECQRCAHERLGVHQEVEKHRKWLREAQKDVELVGDAEQSLERLRVEVAQLRGQLRVEEEEAKQIEAQTVSKKVELADTEEKLEKQSELLQRVEQQRDQVRQEVVMAEEEEARLLANLEQLRHDQAAGGGMHRNLETELELLNAEADKIRAELSFMKTENMEAEERFQLILPALQEARRRVKELEVLLEAAQEEASREKDLGERLERETDSSQEKVRGLRDENVRLSEQCSKLEAQLAQCRPPEQLRPRSSRARPLRSPASTRRGAAKPEADAVRGSPADPGRQKQPSKLQYLSEFIRKEEGKISDLS